MSVYYALRLLLATIALPVAASPCVGHQQSCTNPDFCTTHQTYTECRFILDPSVNPQVNWLSLRYEGNSWCCNVSTGEVAACEEPMQPGYVKCWQVYYISNFDAWDKGECTGMSTSWTGKKCRVVCVTKTTYTRVAGKANNCVQVGEIWQCPPYTDANEYTMSTEDHCRIEVVACG